VSLLRSTTSRGAQAEESAADPSLKFLDLVNEKYINIR